MNESIPDGARAVSKERRIVCALESYAIHQHDLSRLTRVEQRVLSENQSLTFALLMYSFSSGFAGCSRLSSTSVNGDAPSL